MFLTPISVPCYDFYVWLLFQNLSIFTEKTANLQYNEIYTCVEFSLDSKSSTSPLLRILAIHEVIVVDNSVNVQKLLILPKLLIHSLQPGLVSLTTKLHIPTDACTAILS